MDYDVEDQVELFSQKVFKVVHFPTVDVTSHIYFYDPVEEDEFEQDAKVHILFPTEPLPVSSQLYLIYI
ncbi:hypothetical protein YC2023_118708 [Brassica napus]